MEDRHQQAWTAFREVEEFLGPQVREAALDHEAFAQPLQLCALGSCRATCCHDGVLLSTGEATVIAEVVEQKRAVLAEYGWSHAEFLTSDADGQTRSITLPAPEEELAADFPAHFPRTRCVFLDSAHRCVLQRLAMDDERHPWFWKPVSCWIFPLILKPGRGGDRPLLTLARPGQDPRAREDYPGFSSCAPCGKTQKGGQPAWEILRHELELLGKIGGRNLLQELAD